MYHEILLTGWHSESYTLLNKVPAQKHRELNVRFFGFFNSTPSYIQMTWIVQSTAVHSQSFWPLAFDRVNRGKPTKSLFPFFRLPVEVLQNVAPHIPHSDLETLALVDRDCRQLARSVQFLNVRFTFSDVSLGILESLLAEMLEARDECMQGLGPCIRHITVDIGFPLLDKTRLARFPNLTVLYEQLPEMERAQNTYLQALTTVLASLPNLQSFNWQCRVKIPPELMHAVTLSSARHVVINRALFDCDHLDVFDVYGNSKWSVESLVLDVEWLFSDAADDPDIATTIMIDMLRAVSPTLQTLSWKGTRLPSYQSFGWETVHFPRLRNLRLDAVPMGDSSILSSLLSPDSRVSSLEISCSGPATADFLAQRGHLQSMESFSWINHPNAFQEEFITFLEANHQIHSLSIGQPLLPMTIDTRIIPLAFSLLNLTSLHLVWDSSSIPETTLSVIGTLHRLQKLWLSAGSQLGWRHNWKIEHEVMLDALRPLQQLECLMFSRDSYEVNGHLLLDSSIDRYYINHVLPFDLDFVDFLMPDERALLHKFFDLAHFVDMSFDQARSLQSKMRKAAWERWHQERVIRLAKEYARTFSQLKRCHIGQYPIKLERCYSETNAILETPFREENIKPL